MKEILEGQADLDLVGEFDGPLQVLLGVRERRADVVVMDVENAHDTGLETHLLGEYPALLILGVLETGAFVERLCPVRSRLPSGEPRELAAAIRRLVRTPCP